MITEPEEKEVLNMAYTIFAKSFFMKKHMKEPMCQCSQRKSKWM
jgi:hypothetical protein